MNDPVDAARSDAAEAARIAAAAGQVLLDLRGEPGSSADADALRDRADRRAEAVIAAALAAHFPTDAVLSEEREDDPGRLTAPRTWIVDPLDGTFEYGLPGRDDWAVHIALAVEHVAVAGAVALPARGVVYDSATVTVPRFGSAARLRIAVSRSRTAPPVTHMLARLDAVEVRMGSAGAKAMAVVRGEVDGYVHAGGMYQWDSAAPAAVAAAAGLHVSRIDGTPLRYNEPDPWLPDLVICRPDAAARILTALAD